MKLIKHIIPVDIGKNKTLIINSLNGTMDKVDNSTYTLIKKWQNQDIIISNTPLEENLFLNLMKRGYIISNDAEEISKKNEIMHKLRANDQKQRENCNHLTFIMTYDCNFRCPYCFEGVGNPNKKVISTEYIDAALKLANKLNSIGLFGGEPLLPSTVDALKYLISKTTHCIYDITTNGYYLEEFFEILEPLKFAFIMVTLDGNESTHDSRRYLCDSKPTYKRIMSGVQKYLENGIPIRIRMNIDKSNIDECSKLKQELMEKYHMYNKILSFEVSPMMGMKESDQHSIFKQLFYEDKKHNGKERERSNSYWSRYSPIISHLTVGTKIKPNYSFCQAHNNSFLVDPYGYIYPCLPAVGKQKFSIGKYYPQIDFAENSIYNRNIEKIEACRSCVYSLLCGGGCPLRISDSDDFYMPECFSIKNQIHNYLPMFYNAQEGDI